MFTLTARMLNEQQNFSSFHVGASKNRTSVNKVGPQEHPSGTHWIVALGSQAHH
jgi:hypothetical protein